MTLTGRVLIDTSVILAHLSEADDFHGKAVMRFSLASEPFVLLVPVLHEVIALTRKRLSKATAIKAAKSLNNETLYQKYFPDEEHLNQSLALFFRTKGTYSLVDCSLVIAARKLELPIASFDGDFKKLGVKVLA